MVEQALRGGIAVLKRIARGGAVLLRQGQAVARERTQAALQTQPGGAGTVLIAADDSDVPVSVGNQMLHYTFGSGDVVRRNRGEIRHMQRGNIGR